MKERILKTINKYNLIQKGDKIVVGVSGGPDSMCLLDNLIEISKDMDFKIVVAHINHCIREEAIDDEKYVENYCKKNNIEIYIKRADIIKLSKESKKGLEETGREIRYEFFEEIAKKVSANKIAIAHNMNDKIETIVMNIIRGSGTLGLKGIEPKRDNKYIRPIIEIERIDIEKYCKQKNLEPRIDKTNRDNEYTRNKVRNLLIPYIQKEFNPNIIKSINKLSEISREEQNYLEKVVNNIYSKAKIEENENQIVLDLKTFNSQELVIKRRLILYTINKLFGTQKNIEKIHIDDIIKLCERNIGNKYLLPNKFTKIFLKKGKIFFISLK